MNGVSPEDSSGANTDPRGNPASLLHAEVAGGTSEAGSLLDLQKLLELWSTPLPEGPAAEDAMRAMYADPVVINGISTPISDLVSRASTLAAALANPSREIIEQVEAGNKLAVAFRIRGTHVGPLATSAGTLAASGQPITLRVIDILTVVDGLITDVTMVADEVAVLNTLGLLNLGPTQD